MVSSKNGEELFYTFGFVKIIMKNNIDNDCAEQFIFQGSSYFLSYFLRTWRLLFILEITKKNEPFVCKFIDYLKI